MSEIVVEMQQDLEKKFKYLCFIHDQTALHVANEYYELRNMIDIDAEELLKDNHLEDQFGDSVYIDGDRLMSHEVGCLRSVPHFTSQKYAKILRI